VFFLLPTQSRPVVQSEPKGATMKRLIFLAYLAAALATLSGVADLLGVHPFPPMVMANGQPFSRVESAMPWIFGAFGLMAMALVARPRPDRWDRALKELVAKGR